MTDFNIQDTKKYLGSNHLKNLYTLIKLHTYRIAFIVENQNRLREKNLTSRLYICTRKVVLRIHFANVNKKLKYLK